MTELWDSNRPFGIAIAVWVVGGLLFLLAVRLPFSGPVDRLETDTARRDELARHYGSGSQAPNTEPFSAAKKATDAERDALRSALHAARSQVEFKPGPAFAIDPQLAERANTYMNVVKRVASDLHQEANKRGAAIPAALDPRSDGKELPKKEEVDQLLFRLAMSDRIVRTAFAAKVPQVAEINHRLGAPRGVPLAQRLVTVKLIGGLDQIVAFIRECSTPAPASDGRGGVLAVRQVELSGSGGSMVAHVELAAIKFIEVKPRQRVTRRTGPPPRAGRSF